MNISLERILLALSILIFISLLYKIHLKNNRLLNSLTETKKAHRAILANIMHELRTPMSVIMGNLDLLKIWCNENDHSTQEKSVISMSRNGQYLLNILNSLSSRYTQFNKPKETKKEAINLEDLFKSAIKLACSYNPVSEKYVHINFVDTPATVISEDPTAITQILVNLINNALKFSSDSFDRNIIITVSITENNTKPHLEFKVQDFGIGISQNELKNIFTPFFQCNYTMSRPYRGLGLGLTISKNLVKHLGGTIKVTSNYGKGSTFKVSIPVSIKKQEEMPGTEVITAPLSKILLPSANNLHVLIVDDARDILYLYKKYLKNTGHTVSSAENGKQVLDILNKHKYSSNPIDIIFMDLQMPILSGYQTTKILRQKNISIPIIAITAHETAGYENLKLRYGFNEILPKPINKEQLIRKINYYCGRNTKIEDIQGELIS